MSKAKEVLKMADVIEAGEFTAGDNVKFKDSHALAGTFGKVGAINPDGSISVMVGKALQEPCSPSDLEMVDLGVQNGKGAAPAATAQTPDPVGA